MRELDRPGDRAPDRQPPMSGRTPLTHERSDHPPERRWPRATGPSRIGTIQGQGSKTEQIISPKRSAYLLSGLLVCDECNAPMSILAGSSATYYRCSTNRRKGTCKNDVSLRAGKLRPGILGALRARLRSKDGIAHVRQRIAEELRDYSRTMDAEIKTHRERIERTEAHVKGLVGFIADGDRSAAVVHGLRDLEGQSAPAAPHSNGCARTRSSRFGCRARMRSPLWSPISRASSETTSTRTAQSCAAGTGAARSGSSEGRTESLRRGPFFRAPSYSTLGRPKENARHLKEIARRCPTFVAGALLAHLSTGYRGEIWYPKAR